MKILNKIKQKLEELFVKRRNNVLITKLDYEILLEAQRTLRNINKIVDGKDKYSIEIDKNGYSIYLNRDKMNIRIKTFNWDDNPRYALMLAEELFEKLNEK